MLVLSRKPTETIVIGENGKIKVTVLNVKKYQVKIGIEAPKEIMVHREEIFNRIQKSAPTQISHKKPNPKPAPKTNDDIG
jgi:carbon storage regulator